MVKVLQQDRNHPLFGVLSQHLDMQQGITGTTVRPRPKTRSNFPESALTGLGQGIFQHCVEKWNALSEEAKQWFRVNAPPQFCTGYLWYTWSCLIKNYNAGPWSVNKSEIGGHCYIRPSGTEDEIVTEGFVGASELGTLASLVWEPECPDEEYPILLVHGGHLTAFDPIQTWRYMAEELTGLDPATSPYAEWVYDPERPGDDDWAMRRLEAGDRVLYISNYTHNRSVGTPGAIDEYALSLAREIEVICTHEGAERVNIVSHSLGGLVARAYIENEDLPGGFQHINYRGDVNALIMIAPPNRGSCVGELKPEWAGWESIEMLKPGSTFLFALNSGVTGAEKEVEYSIIAGNFFGCPPGWTGTFDLDEEIEMMWFKFLEFIACDPEEDNPFCFVSNLNRYGRDISRRDIVTAATVCGLSLGVTNDGVLTVEETMLSHQAGKPEVPSDRFHLLPQTHTGLLGGVLLPCDTAIVVEIILARYTIEKWRGKGKDIEPPESKYLQRCLNLLARTDACDEIYNHIADTNIIIEFGDVPPGTLATYDPETNTIRVDISAEAEDEKVTGQHIVREAERSRWHGENSISQIYHAFKAEADFWNAVKKGDRDDHCDWVAGIIAQGRREAMEYIRTMPQYAGLPEYSGVPASLTEAFQMLEDRPTGYILCLNAQRMGMEFRYWNIAAIEAHAGQEAEENTAAWYWYEERTGAIVDTWQDESVHAQAAALTFLAVHAWWNEPTSIHLLWHAYYYMALIWETIRGDLTHEFLDFVASIFPRTIPKHSSDLEPEKVWIRDRSQYADIPLWWPPGEAQPPKPISTTGLPPSYEPPSPTDKVDINFASQAELETLPTIGPVLAQRIIENRPYEIIDDIMMVPGIGPLTFQKIKDLICTGPYEPPPEPPEEEEEEPEEEEGLSDEVYIQTCLDLMENTDEGREYYDQLMASGVGIGIKELEEGFWGMYYPGENMIYLATAAKADGVKVGATILLHEAEHTRWKGGNSICQEYCAYKAQSEFWNAVKGSDQHAFFDWCAEMVLQGEDEAMDWLREFYPCSGMHDYNNVDWDITGEFDMFHHLPQGHQKSIDFQRTGVRLAYHHYTMDCFAWYFRDDPRIKSAVVDELWEEDPDEATVAAIAYLLKRVEWDRPDSINQEYVAFKEMAEFWNLVKGDLEHGFCDEVADVMAQGGSAPKDWIRSQDAYADLPEYGP